MIKNISRLLPLLLFAAVVTMIGCKKNNDIAVPAEQAHFMNVSGGSYTITAPGVVYKIPIGLTTPSNAARTVVIGVTSPTGAVQGTHYTLNKTSFTIPAGQVIDTLVVTGNFAQYTSGRKDTLVFTIQGTDKGSSVGASDYNGVFRLFMRGPCAEQEISTSVGDLNGTYSSVERGYNPTTGALGYTAAPYVSAVTGATLLSPTTAEVTVSNIWELGPTAKAKLTLDFTNFAARTVTVQGPEQYLGPGTLVSSTWSTYALYIVPIGTVQPQPAEGTYSYCSGSILFKYRILVKDAATNTPLGYASGAAGITSYTQTLTK